MLRVTGGIAAGGSARRGDNGGVDRAETHLRLVGEAELRRAIHQDADGPAGARFGRVVQALTAVDAIDAGTAGAIEADFALALTARHQKTPGGAPAVSRRGPAARRRISWRPGQPAAFRPMAPPPAPPPGRLVPVGMTIPVQSDQSHGVVCLLTYVQSAAGAWFTTMVRLRSALVPANPVFTPADLPGSELLNRLTATDEAGNGYTLAFWGGGASASNGGAEWSGELRLHPDPPPSVRWLELATGPAGPVTRIDLSQQPPPQVTVAPAALAPGEHLLHRLAALLLGSGRSSIAPGLLVRARDELDDIIEALQVAGALPPLSPVPGQLGTLYARLNVPGFTAVPSCDLPERWLSVLERQRMSPHAAPDESCAGAAVALPELDGIKILILGLHSSENGAVLHAHASGVATGTDESGLPVLWLRDDGGHWHTTRQQSAGTRDSEVTMRLLIVPPLHRSAWIEVVVAGKSAEIRTTLAPRWS